MGGLSIWHMLILFGIVLVAFGPRRLPELGRGIGEAIRGFKKGLRGEEIDVTPTYTNHLPPRTPPVAHPTARDIVDHSTTNANPKGSGSSGPKH